MRRNILCIAAIGLLISIQPPAYSQDAPAQPSSIKLEYKFTPGELLRYKLFEEGNVTLIFENKKMGPEPLQRLSGIFRYRTKSVLPSGDGDTVIAIEKLQRSYMGKIDHAPADRIAVKNVLISPNGITKIVGEPGLSERISDISFAELLPETSVRVGEAWVQVIPAPPIIGEGNMRLDNQLISIDEKVGDYTVAKIRQIVSGPFTNTITIPAHGGTPAMTVNVAGSLSGERILYFSIEKGYLIKRTQNITALASIRIPGVSTASVIVNSGANMVLLPPTDK